MGSKREDPLFLMGDSRSGTTFLANILIRHREIGLAPESKFVIRLLDAFGTKPVSSEQSLTHALNLVCSERKFQDWNIDRSELFALLRPRLPLSLAELVRTIIQFYCAREFPHCTVWGLKKGGRYISDAPQLIEHLPQAKFIHLIRDGRAVFNSKRKAPHSRTGKPLETSAMRAAEQWCEFIEAFDKFSEKHPDNSLEVSYEDMIKNLDEVLNSIFSFLGVTQDTSLVTEAYRSIEPAYVTDRSRHLHPNVGRPPLPERIDAWRGDLTAEEIWTFEMVAAESLEKKGYPIVNENAHRNPTIAYRLRRTAKKLHRLVAG